MAVVLVSGLFIAAFPAEQAEAAQITSRSLTLQAGATDGGSKPGGVVNHLFTFDLPSSTSLGSIKFEYCTTASVSACVTPQGLSTTSATITNQTGAATGFTLNNSTNGAPYLTRTAATITPGTASYTLSTVTNPNVTTPTPQPNYTFFVRISTYSSTDATGSPIDTGSVAASTSTQIELTGTMPESLVFCTGADITVVSTVPDCSTATSGAITFNQLFSPTDTATAVSKMAASTNATSGYSITVNGTTMTSGSNTISALSAASASLKGQGQFGLNLRQNSVAASIPAIGADITPASNTTDFRGNPQTGYDTADTFKFTSGDNVARSDNSTPGTPAATNAQLYTVSYIVNVPGSQPAGTYTTTLTYICTPTF